MFSSLGPAAAEPTGKSTNSINGDGNTFTGRNEDSSSSSSSSSLSDIHHDLQYILQLQKRRLLEAHRGSSYNALGEELENGHSSRLSNGAAAAVDGGSTSGDDDVQQEVALAPKYPSELAPAYGNSHSNRHPSSTYHGTHQDGGAPMERERGMLNPHQRRIVPLTHAGMHLPNRYPQPQQQQQQGRIFSPLFPPAATSAQRSHPPDKKDEQPPRPASAAAVFVPGSGGATPIPLSPQYALFLAQLQHQQRRHHEVLKQRTRERRRRTASTQNKDSGGSCHHSSRRQQQDAVGRHKAADSSTPSGSSSGGADDDDDDEVRTQDFYYDRYPQSLHHHHHHYSSTHNSNGGGGTGGGGRPIISRPPPFPPRNAAVQGRRSASHENHVSDRVDASRVVGRGKQQQVRHRSPPLAMMPGHQRLDEGYTLAADIGVGRTTRNRRSSRGRSGGSSRKRIMDSAPPLTDGLDNGHGEDGSDGGAGAFDAYLAEDTPIFRRGKQPNYNSYYSHSPETNAGTAAIPAVVMNSPSTIRDDDADGAGPGSGGGGGGLADLSFPPPPPPPLHSPSAQQQQQQQQESDSARAGGDVRLRDSRVARGGGHRANNSGDAVSREGGEGWRARHKKMHSPVEPFADILNEEVKRNSINSSAAYMSPHNVNSSNAYSINSPAQAPPQGQWESAPPIHATGFTRRSAKRPETMDAPAVRPTTTTAVGAGGSGAAILVGRQVFLPKKSGGYLADYDAIHDDNNSNDNSSKSGTDGRQQRVNINPRGRRQRADVVTRPRMRRAGSSLIPERGTISTRSGRTRGWSGSAKGAKSNPHGHGSAPASPAGRRGRRGGSFSPRGYRLNSRLTRSRSLSRGRDRRQGGRHGNVTAAAVVGLPITFRRHERATRPLGRRTGPAVVLLDAIPSSSSSSSNSSNTQQRDSPFHRRREALDDVCREQEALMAHPRSSSGKMGRGEAGQGELGWHGRRHTASASPTRRSKPERVSTAALWRDVKGLWAAPSQSATAHSFHGYPCGKDRRVQQVAGRQAVAQEPVSHPPRVPPPPSFPSTEPPAAATAAAGGGDDDDAGLAKPNDRDGPRRVGNGNVSYMSSPLLPLPSSYIAQGLIGAVLTDAFAEARRRIKAREKRATQRQ